MSVLIPDLKVYEYMHAGTIRAAYRTQVDEFYSYSLHVHFKHKDIEKESSRLVKSWLDMNEKSYDLKYNEKPDSKPLSTFLTWSNFPNLRATQVLKFVQCVIYNIELSHWKPSEQENADHELLKKWEFELLSAIVDQIPEYKEAKWCDAPENHPQTV